MRCFFVVLGCLGFVLGGVALEGCSGKEASGDGNDADGSPNPSPEGGVDSGDLESGGSDRSTHPDSTPELDAGVDGPFTEAKHAAFPQVIYQDGGIITAPQLVTVTFPGDTLADSLVSFGQTVESSSWWTTVIAGYCESGGAPCISAGATAMSVAYPTAPASSYTDSDQGGASTLRTFLEDAITSAILPAPQPGAISNTLYLVYFPTSTVINFDGSASCQAFDGYHGSFPYGGQQVPYAVIPECSGASAGETPPVTTLQNTTITASHEILEAASDPSDVSTGYFMSFTDTANFGWLDVEGGEIADLCVDPFLLAQDEWAEGSFIVQRIWSNANAQAGLDPCVPVPSGEVYFSGAPVQSFFVMDVGTTLTFEVDAFSTGPRDNWTLSAQDWTNASTSYLSFTIEGGTDNPMLGSILSVNNGTKVQVKMTLTQDPGSTYDGEADGSIVSLAGNVDNPTAVHFWPFAVMTPTDAVNAGVDASLSMNSKRRGTRATNHPPPPRRPMKPRSLLR
jgi:hypothetical protein